VLAQRIADARAGTGGAVVVEGAPGIGKSRLLAEAGQPRHSVDGAAYQVTARLSPAVLLGPTSVLIPSIGSPHVRP
jgi:MoxR-like ATPase